MTDRSMGLRGAIASGLIAVTLIAGCGAGSGATPTPSTARPGGAAMGACPARTEPARDPQPPSATPLAEQPSEPAGDGTTVTLCTEAGDVVVELFTESAPVATVNFLGLAEAGFYAGVPFHRIIPGFMIQGGDPTGTGTGGPGYTIPDEPFAGDYTRGMVAMARTPRPDSQGSQFFILVGDAPHLQGGGYTIFGRVTAGMEIVDEIVGGPTNGDLAVDPVVIGNVAVDRP
jgi:peptidyl-prolyl cis-trans isomerase B (cyclophilin B)